MTCSERLVRATAGIGVGGAGDSIGGKGIFLESGEGDPVLEIDRPFGMEGRRSSKSTRVLLSDMDRDALSTDLRTRVVAGAVEGMGDGDAVILGT